MKTKRLLAILFAVSLLAVSCKKTCRCYRYDGNVEEYSEEYLEQNNTTCAALEDIDFGLVNSLCEKVIF